MSDSTHEIKVLGGRPAQQFNVAEMEHRHAPNFSFVYTNIVSLSLNFFDCQVIFGQILSTDPKSMHIEDRVSVTMSIEHAKALAKGLNDTVEQYEKVHGPVRTAPLLDKV
jgi:hypothetical protein